MNKKFILTLTTTVIIIAGGVFYFWNQQQSGGNRGITTTDFFPNPLRREIFDFLPQRGKRAKWLDGVLVVRRESFCEA